MLEQPKQTSEMTKRIWAVLEWWWWEGRKEKTAVRHSPRSRLTRESVLRPRLWHASADRKWEFYPSKYHLLRYDTCSSPRVPLNRRLLQEMTA